MQIDPQGCGNEKRMLDSVLLTAPVTGPVPVPALIPLALNFFSLGLFASSRRCRESKAEWRTAIFSAS